MVQNALSDDASSVTEATKMLSDMCSEAHTESAQAATGAIFSVVIVIIDIIIVIVSFCYFLAIIVAIIIIIITIIIIIIIVVAVIIIIRFLLLSDFLLLYSVTSPCSLDTVVSLSLLNCCVAQCQYCYCYDFVIITVITVFPYS